MCTIKKSFVCHYKPSSGFLVDMGSSDLLPKSMYSIITSCLPCVKRGVFVTHASGKTLV